jgi:chromosome segregation ATPase
MPSRRLPGMPPLLGAADVLRRMQTQTEMMTELPEILAELTRAARTLAETVESTKETAASANRVVSRVEALLNELEDPVQRLRPGIERVGEVLDAPVVRRLPELLESVENAVLPVTRRAERLRLHLARLGERRRQTAARLRRLGLSPQAAGGEPPSSAKHGFTP